jgi:type IV pilus assembly protein PilC
VVALMFSIGERSGAIAEVLEKIGNYYDDQVATTTEALVSLIEPVMIVVMGVLVAIIAVSMFLPIFNLTKMMR